VADSAGRTEFVAATPEAILDALAAVESYPDWQTGVSAAQVHERDEHGRATLVELTVDIKIRQIRYTARYFYEPEAGRAGFDLVEGDLKQITGRYSFAPRAGGTDVTIDIVTDPGFRIPGPLMRMIRDQALKTSMRDLRHRVEA
jgi:ribosome-associated toxin RatA of RatAB toxin-antitoxin module